MRELYVYYRVPLAGIARASAAVSQLQRELRAAFPGLHARVLRRIEAADGTETWMEVYSVDPAARRGGIDAALQREIETRAERLLAPLAGQRHCETFEPCAW